MKQLHDLVANSRKMSEFPKILHGIILRMAKMYYGHKLDKTIYELHVFSMEFNTGLKTKLSPKLSNCVIRQFTENYLERFVTLELCYWNESRFS